MKIAIAHRRDGQQVMYDRNGDAIAFVVFKWLHVDRSEQGWVVHLAAFCSAVTEDFKFERFQGVISFGWSEGPLLAFSTGILTHQVHLKLKGVLHALYRRLL
jgi:hypothetical protein